MEYNFTIPQLPVLQSIVCSFWQTDRNTAYQTEVIIPKGIVEIIFNFSEQSAIQAQLGNRQYQLPRCFINGFNTRPVRVQLPVRQTFFGVRFQPSAISTIFGVPAGEFADHSADLTLIDASLDSLWYQLIEQASFDDRVLLFSKWLSGRYFTIAERDKLLNHFLNNQQQEIPSVKEVSKFLCYSPRHVARKFTALTGMNTEELLLYKKYLYSLHLLQHTNLSLTEIAYQCQFADQSHFIKTFKSLTLITPGEYKKVKSPIPGHIYHNVR
jgi:AraC-like DNA-binding protein